MAGVVIDEAHALVRQAEVARHVATSLTVGERRLAGCRVEQAEPCAEFPSAARQRPSRRPEADCVVAAHVGLVAHHPVHPFIGRDAGSGQHDAVDDAWSQAELSQQRVDRAARIAGVVLQAGKPLLGGAADDLAVLEDGGGRAVSLTDAQNDHDPTIITANPYAPEPWTDRLAGRRMVRMTSSFAKTSRESPWKMISPRSIA